jgi:exodeoxyribonuclease III
LHRGEPPVQTRAGLPGEPDAAQSRYIEALVNGVLIGCLYLPNGNPAPGPRFDYKLAWFEAFLGYAASLIARNIPVVLAGDYNVMPTELDVYKPERWVDDGCFVPRSAMRLRGLSRKAGPTRCGRSTQESASIRSGITFAMRSAAMPGCASTM